MWGADRRILLSSFRSNKLSGFDRFVKPTARIPGTGGFHTVKYHLDNTKTERMALLPFLQQLRDHERTGVPKDAGTDTQKGFDLGRMRRLTQNLGNPTSCYPMVHVAGTKGKGSTVAFLSNILRAAGYRVGTYTSPHMKTIHERICVGHAVTEDALDKLFQSVREPLLASIEAENNYLTHFEVFTALAFKYFAEENVDIAVVEAGLGGARDATNIVLPEDLAASVIVSIGEEHLEALGGSLESVALAKAGIIKQGRPIILGRQPNTVAESIVRAQACAQNAPIIQTSDQHVHGVVKRFERADSSWLQVCDVAVKAGFKLQGDYTLDEDLHLADCKMRMFGDHQVDNALTAICTALCLRAQGWKIPNSAFHEGLEGTHVPGRFQILSPEQAEVLGLSDKTVVLDGAHTPGSAAALGSTLKSLFPRESVALVTAMASDKDHYSFASAFLQEVKPVVIITTSASVAGSSARSASKEAVLSAWVRAGPGMPTVLSCSETVEDALETAKSANSQVICVTGSLHLVSAVLDLCVVQ